jgi:hypothetical protein
MIGGQMDAITPEEAKKFIAEDSPPEQVITPKSGIPWQETPPTSWVDFLTLMVRFTEYKGWELEFDTVEDMSLVIFGHDDQNADGTKVHQGRLPFDEDELPF